MISNIPVKKIYDEKNKKVYIRLIFLNEYKAEDVTKYSLLCNVLSNSSKKYNNKRKICDKLCELYDSGLYFTTRGIYKTRVTSVTLSFINEKYLNDSNILDESIKLMYEFLLKPNLYKDAFEEKAFNEEKDNLRTEIKKIYNNKERYALNRALEEMCPNELVSVESIGNLKDLEEINPKNLYDTYLELINQTEKYFYLYGDNIDIIEDKLQIFSDLKSQKQSLESVMKTNIFHENVKEYFETSKVNQAKLILGYRTSISNIDNDYEALELFCEMFGGMTMSNLFRVVREKHGLCYNIESFLFDDAKIMIVDAGIDKKNYQKTIELVNEELVKFKDGKINKALLESCKLDYLNQLEESTDSPNDMLTLEIESMILGYINDINILKQKVKKVTIKDIKRVANTINLDTIYMLSE